MPAVNEPYYLGKALHFWMPEWGGGDFFLESADAHQLFCLMFGWVTCWISLPATAWVGRLLTWTLLAWAWRRLSFRLTQTPWVGLLSAGLFVFLSPRCAMAGEWIIGGVEAKGFAYGLVLLGLEALVAGQWRRMWLLLGAATAMHSLVGGWTMLAAGMVWLGGVVTAVRRQKASGASAGAQLRESVAQLGKMLPSMAGGFALALVGLIPSLRLSWGVGAELAAEAYEIYVYRRLGHHLDPWQFPPQHILRFGLLVVVWLLLARLTARTDGPRRLRALVNASLLIALGGFALGLIELWRPALAAALLRFYWFRLSDALVPIGVALCSTLLIVQLATNFGRRVAGWATFGASLPVIGHLTLCVAGWGLPAPNLVDEFPYHDEWRDVCRWIAASDIPRNARFLTPRSAQTFKWYTGRPEVGNWKEVPQDARSLVEWWRRMNTLHASGWDPPDEIWLESLLLHDAETLWELGRRYQARYLVDFTSQTQPPPLVRLYENAAYAVYRLPE